MKWLPSFVKLFLLFVAGVVLLFVGAIVSMEHPGNSTLSSAFDILRLVGLAMMLISPILIALKFFAQLDRKAK
ncbi:MAG: hypothetical protein ACRYF0_10235 [Janthinobacterium lividum]